MPGWISFLQNHTTATVQFDIVDPHTLSHEQLFAYNIVKDHFHQHNGNHDPLYMIILGFAGTGKSYLIDALRGPLGRACAVTAPTGKAAFNIKGTSIHSLSHLLIGSKGHQELSGQTLVEFQRKLREIVYIVIEEF